MAPVPPVAITAAIMAALLITVAITAAVIITAERRW
jgi:hypothetical protein